MDISASLTHCGQPAPHLYEFAFHGIHAKFLCYEKSASFSYEGDEREPSRLGAMCGDTEIFEISLRIKEFSTLDHIILKIVCERANYPVFRGS